MRDYSGVVISEILVVLVLLVLVTDSGTKLWYSLLGQTRVVGSRPNSANGSPALQNPPIPPLIPGLPEWLTNPLPHINIPGAGW